MRSLCAHFVLPLNESAHRKIGMLIWTLSKYMFGFYEEEVRTRKKQVYKLSW